MGGVTLIVQDMIALFSSLNDYLNLISKVESVKKIKAFELISIIGNTRDKVWSDLTLLFTVTLMV